MLTQRWCSKDWDGNLPGIREMLEWEDGTGEAVFPISVRVWPEAL